MLLLIALTGCTDGDRNGVPTAGGPTPGTTLADIPENNAAMEKCRHLLPAPRAGASRTPGAGG